MNRIEKLEQIHVAPYWPHGIWWYDPETKTQWATMTIGVCGEIEIQRCDEPATPETPVRRCISVDNTFGFKMILRSISDIVNEIDVEGDKFVPIVELARSNHVLYDDEFEISNILCKDTYCYIDYFDNSFDSQHRFYYDFTGKTFQCGKIDPNEHNSIRNGLDLFNKLFQWHFDVFCLIESGLAVDINTLKLEV